MESYICVNGGQYSVTHPILIISTHAIVYEASLGGVRSTLIVNGPRRATTLELGGQLLLFDAFSRGMFMGRSLSTLFEDRPCDIGTS